MYTQRVSGVLAHLRSLPGPGDAGMLGREARRFVDFLAAAGFSVWQVLPINPVDRWGSPYQSYCGHAGDPGFISLEPADLGFDPGTGGPGDPDSIDALMALKQAFDRTAPVAQVAAFETFTRAQAFWLDDYARFRVLRRHFRDQSWIAWPAEIRDRTAEALRAVDAESAPALLAYRFQQYLFEHQWQGLRAYAAGKGIGLFGDLPMFVAHDSVDVWAHRRCFQLADTGLPLAVSGVPPDYFSADGQLWGTPLYDWNALRARHFDWWIARIQRQRELFDLVRLDHFRGFVGVWAVPPTDRTAAHGIWQPVPGTEFFAALARVCNPLALVAEDLGSITPEVTELKERMGLPGIKVLQFAFDSDARNPYLPHNHDRNSMVCTGTHDNNTTRGWFAEIDEQKRQRVLEYCAYPQEPMPWPLIRLALASVCFLSVVPLQDWLELDAAHRLNTPGTTTGNWQWRAAREALTPTLAARIRALHVEYRRLAS